MPRKLKTEEEILNAWAQAAWEYRQRQREELKSAPSSVKHEHAVKARKYRKRYVECWKAEPTTCPNSSKTCQKKTLQQKEEKKVPTTSTPTTRVLSPVPTTPRKKSKGGNAVKASTKHLLKGPHSPPVTLRKAWSPQSPSPRSLGAITRECSDDGVDADDEGDNEEDEYEQDVEKKEKTQAKDCEDKDGWARWEKDFDISAEYEAELGPLLNPTGHPDYIPIPGQQPYFKQGRRYWF
ncbi:hypothetical protein C8R43DRAFT_1140604 [Mycena crocata]|nr:hypothetical protein C8R43DRAFT_1140604 [Mycena crocata]